MEGQGTEFHVVRLLRRNVHAASVAVILIGLAVMVGWFFDVPLLKSVLPQYVTMKFNTALCFVMAGMALCCLLCENKVWRYLGTFLALLVFAVGATSFSEYVWGWDTGIDNLIFREEPGAVATVVPGRMAGITSVAFVLIGLSLLPVNTRTGWHLLASQLSALAVVFLSLLALIGYWYGQEIFYSFGEYSSIALHTALAFLILGLGILGTRPHCYIMKHITSDAIGGVMARRLIPFAILVPILVGWIHLQWHNGSSGNWRIGESVEVLSIILIFVVLIIWYARSLNRMDVTRQRREAEKREGDKRMQVVGKALSDAVMDWNLMTNEVWLSESFYTFFGYSPQKTVPSIEFWKEGLHPDDRVRVWDKMNELVGGDQDSCSSEYRFRRKNGAYAHILGRGYLIRDETGRAMHMVCAMIDMTKKKKAEELQREREQMESRYQFISTVSHELRSPLTVIQNGIEMVTDGVDGPVTEEQKVHLGMSLHHIERLNRMVNDVLDFQKMETGRMPFHLAPQDVNFIAAEAVRGFRDEAQKKGISLGLHLEPVLPRIVCDPDALEQVMTNLISNAIKYSDHGHVTVKTQRYGDHQIRVAVSDEGIGIKKEDQDKLFNSFFRIETPGVPRREGTGLGLAICKKIIDACHGKIGVSSELGHGSTFYFTLPIIQK